MIKGDVKNLVSKMKYDIKNYYYITFVPNN